MAPGSQSLLSARNKSRWAEEERAGESERWHQWVRVEKGQWENAGGHAEMTLDPGSPDTSPRSLTLAPGGRISSSASAPKRRWLFRVLWCVGLVLKLDTHPCGPETAGQSTVHPAL